MAKRRCNAADYLATMDTLESKFEDESYPVHSFPELSLVAWTDKGSKASPADPEEEDGDEHSNDSAMPAGGDAPADPYSVDDIVADGCFLDRDELDRLISRLRSKKNLILQGPPGTRKDHGWQSGWRLPWSGSAITVKVKAVQFRESVL